MKVQSLLMLVCVGLLLPIGAMPTLAKPSAEDTSQSQTHPTNKAQNPTTQILFKPSGGPPPTTRGAGSRNDRQCAQDTPSNGKPPLTALVPSGQMGLTWTERPTVWVYLPETSARQIVLSLKEGSRPHSQRFIPIASTPGVVGIPLTENAPPLEVGKSYQWVVVLVCGDRPNPNDPVITAAIQRVTPAKPFTSPSATEQAAWYGQHGVWYDALTALAEARRSQPNNPALAKLWADFLAQSSVGLGTIAAEPLRLR